MRPLLALALTLPLLAAAAPEPPLPLPDGPLALREDPPLPGEPADGWPGLQAPPAGDVLDVDAAVALARAHQPALRAARTDVAAARAERAAAGRIANPTFEAEIVPDAAGDEVELTGRVDVTDGVVAALRVRVADARLDVERARAEAAAVRLDADVRVAFRALQAAELRLAIGQRALEVQAVDRDVARALLEAGNVPWSDAVPREAAWERTRLVVAGLELDVVTARERLAALLGTPGAALRVAPLPDVPPDPPPADLEARAVAASLELAELRAAVDALGRTGALRRVEGWLPEVALGLRAVNDRVGADLGGTPEPWRLGGTVEVSVPLFAQGVAAGHAADLRRDALAWDLDAEAATLRADARTAAARLAAATARAVHLRDVVLPRQRDVTEATRLQFDAMQVGVFQLLQARRAELDTELELADAIRDAWSARVAVDALAAGVRVDVPAPVAAGAVAPTPDGGH